MKTLIFLCNPEEGLNAETRMTLNQELPQLIAEQLISGNHYIIGGWSCANSKSVEVGDRAFLLKTGKNRGFIAAGYVDKAPRQEQLRLKRSAYKDLSEAYIGGGGSCFYVCLKIDSVVDMDSPLEPQNINLPLGFKHFKFTFYGGGKSLDANIIPHLEKSWEEHSMRLHRLKKGCRLVDVFCDKGDIFRNSKDYQSAINAYKQALQIKSNYAKAINKIEICDRAINKKQPKPKPPEIVQLDNARDILDSQGDFSSASTEEAVERIIYSIARRQGQTKFRQKLLEAYQYRCAITDFDVESALEAAHIIPYVETENNHPSNGILLRADLHTLFDLNLIAIHPEKMQILLSPDLKMSKYSELHGKVLRTPISSYPSPNLEFLQQRFQQCSWHKES